MAFTNFSILTKEMFFLLWLLIVIIIIIILTLPFSSPFDHRSVMSKPGYLCTKELIRTGTHEAEESVTQQASFIVVCIH